MPDHEGCPPRDYWALFSVGSSSVSSLTTYEAGLDSADNASLTSRRASMERWRCFSSRPCSSAVERELIASPGRMTL